MASITINEISQNYSYNIGTSSFATVALPITSCWGPGFFKPESEGVDSEDLLESITWQQFPATQSGLESFVSNYRGPAASYRVAKDYSYQMAMTLLTAGYDVLVCRLNPGVKAEGKIQIGTGENVHDLTIKAKYPGTFGNSLRVLLTPVSRKVLVDGNLEDRNYWNIVVYVVDSSGVRTAVENLVTVFELDNSTDSIMYVEELDSDFIEFVGYESIKDTDTIDTTNDNNVTTLTGGSDKEASSDDAAAMMQSAINYAKSRYGTTTETPKYIEALTTLSADPNLDTATAEIRRYREWCYTYACTVYTLLQDKLSYNPQRIISPGWDDQNISEINESVVTHLSIISPIHRVLMETAFRSRCATALIDIPKCLARSGVYNESTKSGEEGYAQLLARYTPSNAITDVNGSLFATHSALFAPWGQYTYVGTSKQSTASPAFLNLMIQRAMILNQSLQYEWALPTSRKHTLRVGKMDYTVPKKVMDEWQKLEGVGVNIITRIPDLGLTCWGNSTLYEVPPATYQALSNLSTRYLVNAVENVAYKCGISITYTYNNSQAYNSFYAGVTPILDTMKNVGAIEGYYVRMSADIDGLDQVNANSVIGKIYLLVNGVVNDITVDLIALPPSADLDQYKA